jgi:hypothetical protein
MTSPQIQQANFEISRTVAECLNAHYPGHAWACVANIETGLVSVYNMALSGEWGFILHCDRLLNDPSMKLVVMAGGELLERYNLSRGTAKNHEYDNLEFDIKGNAVFQA